MDTAVIAVGLAAGLITTLAFIPRVVRIWRTRSAQDISLPTFSGLAFGTVPWLVYGVLAGDIPPMASNTVSLGLVSAVPWGKIRFG